MPIPSRVLNSGSNSLATVSICGDGSAGLTAAGTNAATALQLVKVYNNLTSVAAGTGVKLPPTEEGETIFIANSGTSPVKVYPYEGATTISGSSYINLAKGFSCVLFAETRTKWEALKGFNAVNETFYYGSFYDMTTQTAASTNTAYGVTFNTTAESNGVSIGSPTSRVVVANRGVYNIQFSAQLDKTAAAVGNVYIWLRINGVNVTDSAGKIALQGSNAEQIAAWNYVITLAANDYIELMWSTDDTNCYIAVFPASGPVPGIPSMILTVVQES